jgi:hypothetical protein
MDGASIRDYTERIASRYHVLESNTIFQSEVTSAAWNAMTNRWEVYIRDLTGKVSKEPVMYTCKILVSAVGNLTLPVSITNKAFSLLVMLRYRRRNPSTYPDKRLLKVGSFTQELMMKPST